jgi:1,4-dihydroxy-2-naphthoate octaprenyltransferase
MVSKGKVYFYASRPFAFPWVIVNSLVAVILAHGSIFQTIYYGIMGSAITTSLVATSHFVNNWRDYVKGLDKVEKGSTAKSYTSASQLIPMGLMTVQENKALALFSQMLGVLLFFFVPHNIFTITFFLLGSVLAWTYTDFFKPKGIGEVALFLGHGFGTAMFAFSLVRIPNIMAISLGILLGLWASFMLTLDQYPDVKNSDFEKRIRNMASLLVGSDLKPGEFIMGASILIYIVQIGFVFLHWLPIYSLATFILLPVLHLNSLLIQNNYGKGMQLFLICMLLYPILVVL